MLNEREVEQVPQGTIDPVSNPARFCSWSAAVYGGNRFRLPRGGSQ
jgi:hypothetical protein